MFKALQFSPHNNILVTSLLTFSFYASSPAMFVQTTTTAIF